jgi:hypothetical protein
MRELDKLWNIPAWFRRKSNEVAIYGAQVVKVTASYKIRKKSLPNLPARLYLERGARSIPSVEAAKRSPRLASN